jgi:hypothetical protein
MMPIERYNRETFLGDRLNNFLIRELCLPEADYYGCLSVEALLSLKCVLADINNIFTLRVSLHFAEWLGSRFSLESAEVRRIRESIVTTKPGANGFDIHMPGTPRLIAEVKCNVPINGGDYYGAKQREGIEKDVTALLHGKSKAKLNVSNYLKFLVLLDRPAIRAATEHLLQTSQLCKEKVIVAPTCARLDRYDVVYVAYVGAPAETPL